MNTLIAGSLSQPIQTSLMSLMITMRKVESGNTHTSINQLLESWDIPTCRTESADDFGVASLDIGGRRDGVQRYVSTSKFRS